MSLAWPIEAARPALSKALREAGFKLQRVNATDSVLVTHPRFGWGNPPLSRHWQQHAHPGVVVRASAAAEGDSSRVNLELRAVCATPPDEPPHDHGTPAEAALVPATIDAQMAVRKQYEQWLKIHGMAQPPALAGAGVAPSALELSPKRPSGFDVHTGGRR